MWTDKPDSKSETQNNQLSLVELWMKDEILGADALVSLDFDYSCPGYMPIMPEGCKLICGYDQGLGERMFVCNDMDWVRELFGWYSRGWAFSIKWYYWEDPGFLG